MSFDELMLRKPSIALPIFPGFRCGVVYSWNPYVNKSMSLLSQFTAVPMPVQDKLLCFLTTQAKFIKEIFIPYNQTRLQKAKDRMIERLELLDIDVGF